MTYRNWPTCCLCILFSFSSSFPYFLWFLSSLLEFIFRYFSIFLFCFSSRFMLGFSPFYIFLHFLILLFLQLYSFVSLLFIWSVLFLFLVLFFSLYIFSFYYFVHLPIFLVNCSHFLLFCVPDFFCPVLLACFYHCYHLIPFISFSSLLFQAWFTYFSSFSLFAYSSSFPFLLPSFC